MIANLIYTLMLALGVASGSYQSETSNAFKHVEERHEKPIQRAVTPINDVYDFVEAQHYRETRETTNDTHYIKYILSNDNEPNGSVNLLTDYGLLINTIYEIDEPNPDNHFYQTQYYAVLKFVNYYESMLDINLYSKLQAVLNITGQASQTIRKECFITDDTTTDSLIDMQANASLPDRIYDLVYTDITWDETRQMQQDTQYVNGNQDYEYRNLQEDIYVSYRQTKYVLLKLTIFTAHTDLQTTTDQSITITGNYNNTSGNYEVVDIPNLMFTIITLPFAWYSTAFNLTIFPNTPYQLNFGNLIMTIVAALVLLYLIKKVLK